LITGKLATDSLKDQIKEKGHEIKILTLPVSVAVFISPDYAAKELRDKDLTNFDIILMPGSVEGDVSIVEAVTGIPTYKGTYHLTDIGLLLDHLDEIVLSPVKAASELLKDKLREKALSEIKIVEDNWRNILEKNSGFAIGSEKIVPIGMAFPTRIAAEIVNAPLLNLIDLRSKVKYYQKKGADIIDIGMLANNPKPERIKDIISAIRAISDLPISIDTLNPSEINASIDAGIDLILSIDSGNMKEVITDGHQVPVVVIPGDIGRGYFPREIDQRIKSLNKNIDEAKRLGFQKIIADPVLEPPISPGIMNSLGAFKAFRELDNETLMLMGIGNVAELVDIDSPGVNGILSIIAQEINIQILHTPEYSVKAKNSVRELSIATKMGFISKKKETIPKDLGIDLLIMKEKRWSEETYNEDIEKNLPILTNGKNKKYIPDKAGWFKILIDRKNKKIVAIHYPINNNQPDNLVKADNAIDIYKIIIENNLINRIDHAAYLGKELMKAELALKINRSYIQDAPLFESFI
jgi:dihydropteroate synthase-like protein